MADKKESNTVSQAEMVKHIRNRLKNEYELDASRELVKAVLEIFDDEIYMLIAENKVYNCLWGKIGGKSKPPVKVCGKFSEIKSVRDNFGYSTWKNGFPYIEWSKVMKVYDIYPPEDYFALPENRYTTAARTFRKDANMPEIPEFENLSEEKILEICAKADQLQINKLTSRQRANKMRDDKYNKIKVLATQDY